MTAELRQQVEHLLKSYPDMRRIAAVAVEGARVYVTVEVDPARGAALESQRQEAERALYALPGISAVQLVMTAERAAPPALAVKGQPASGRAAGVQHKISSRPVAPGVRHIIAVASGKGGVGKSTVAAGLARAFAAEGKAAGLLDADIYGASQPLMMGRREKPETDDDGMIVPLDAGGVKLMSMGFFVDPEAPVIWRGPMVHSAIQQLFRDVRWGALDVLVVDLPPGTGDAQLSLAQNVPLKGAVIVTTPQEVALTQAQKGLKMFEKTKVPVLGIVENMSRHVCSHCGASEHIFGEGRVRQAAEAAGVDYLGDIPLSGDLCRAADAGRAAGGDVFANIAARIWIKL